MGMEKSKELIVFTNGVFDILHIGHMQLLSFCRDLAGKDGKVIVGINSDRSAYFVKRTPIFNENIRRQMLLCTKFVDDVVIFHEPTPLEKIKNVKPHYIVKGHDYIGKPVVGENYARIVYSPKLSDWHTSKIIDEVIDRYGKAKE